MATKQRTDFSLAIGASMARNCRAMDAASMIWGMWGNMPHMGHWRLGFLNDTNDSKDGNDELRLFCLEELDQSIKEDGTLLKVFLIDVAKRPVAHETDLSKRMRLLNDPSQISFSIEISVIDACVTNSGFMWINKHFYL